MKDTYLASHLQPHSDIATSIFCSPNSSCKNTKQTYATSGGPFLNVLQILRKSSLCRSTKQVIICQMDLEVPMAKSRW